MKQCLVVLILLVLGECGLARNGPKSDQNYITFDRMFQIWYENALFSDVLADPYFKSLSQQGQFLANYFAITHPSQPNYVAAIAGSTLGVNSDGTWNLPETSIIDLFEERGISWKVYAEEYPGGCFTGPYNGTYVSDHNPFISFTRISGNPERCAKIVNSAQLAIDIQSGNLAEYIWYIPNTLNDGHDTNISYASAWTKSFLTPLLANPQFMAGNLVILTYDEAEFPNGNNSLTNQVYTVLLGGPGVPVSVGLSDYTPYTHYSLVSSVEKNWNLRTLGRYDKIATPFLRYTPACGDGVATGTEQCDLGYLFRNRAWISACCSETTCQFLPANTTCGVNTGYVPLGCTGPNLVCYPDGNGCGELIYAAGTPCQLGSQSGVCAGGYNTSCIV